MAKKEPQLPTIENRKARFEYAIEDTLEVGIVLRGSEIKVVREGRVSLGEGWVKPTFEPASLLLYGVHIGEYKPAGTLGHKAVRPRELLANRVEIRRLCKAMENKGATIVPLKLYFKGAWAKLLLGIAKGKKAHDKRQAIKDRDNKRDLQRAMSKRM
jgi:SsrA-binding protein